MKVFTVKWKENKVVVFIQNELDQVEIEYKKYREICEKHEFTLMRDIHSDIEYYTINSEWFLPSYIKIKGQAQKVDLKFLGIKVTGAVEAINNIDIFIKKSFGLEDDDDDFPLIKKPTEITMLLLKEEDSEHCCIKPKCNIY